MGYDVATAEQVREALSGYSGVSERPMIGGLAFLIGGHLVCEVMSELLLVPLDASRPHPELPAGASGAAVGAVGGGIVRVPLRSLSTKKLLAWVKMGAERASLEAPRDLSKVKGINLAKARPRKAEKRKKLVAQGSRANVPQPAALTARPTASTLVGVWDQTYVSGGEATGKKGPSGAPAKPAKSGTAEDAVSALPKAGSDRASAGTKAKQSDKPSKTKKSGKANASGKASKRSSDVKKDHQADSAKAGKQANAGKQAKNAKKAGKQANEAKKAEKAEKGKKGKKAKAADKGMKVTSDTPVQPKSGKSGKSKAEKPKKPPRPEEQQPKPTPAKTKPMSDKHQNATAKKKSRLAKFLAERGAAAGLARPATA